MNQNFFHGVDHARQYLRGCIVFHDGEIKHILNVQRIGGRYILGLADLPAMWDRHRTEPETQSVRFTDVKLLPDHLGWMNLPPQWNTTGCNVACYVQRLPVRAWKVGISSDNVKGFGAGRFSGYNMSGSILINIENFKCFFDDDYPTLEEAEVMVADGGSTMQVAISSNIMIENGDVYYGSITAPIGRVEGGSIVLDDRRSFLREALDMEGIKC